MDNNDIITIELHLIDKMAAISDRSNVKCVICGITEGANKCFSHCINCITHYCDDCATFNKNEWKIAERRKKYLGGGFMRYAPIYQSCISCVSGNDSIVEIREMLLSRVAIVADTCFQCRGVSKYELSRCIGCCRKWCDNCKDNCAGANATKFTTDMGCFEIDYFEYESCAMCRIGTEKKEESDKVCVEQITENLIDTIAKTDLSELFDLADYDYGETVQKIKHKIADNGPRKKRM